MTRTPYVTGRPRRALAAVAATLTLVAGLAGCNLNASPGADATATAGPTDVVAAEPATPTATVPSTGTKGSKATPTPTDEVTPLGPLSGTWEGTWVNTTPVPAIGTFTLVWAQQGTRLFGALTVTGSDCLRAGNVTGQVVGRGFRFGAVEGDTTIEYTGTIVDDDTIEGTYQSECGDSAGTWSATRTRP
jgi:hypothetical protein